jgi:hypothetical protein
LWYRRGDAREAAAWSSRILAGDVAAIPPRLLAAAHVAASFAADLAMDLASAAAHADAAVELAREEDDASGLVLGLWGAAHVTLARGDLHSLSGKALEALELCDRHGLPWARARPLSLLGYATLLGGSPEEALERFDECLPLFRGLGDVGSMVIMGMVPRCEAALRAGHLELAERYATEAVQASVGTAWEAAALVQDAIVLQARGDVAGAEVAARRGLSVALAAGLNQWVRVALRELARSAVRADRLVDAARLYGASRRGLPLPLLEPAVYGSIEARCREGLGDARFERLAAAGASMTESELGDIAPFA